MVKLWIIGEIVHIESSQYDGMACVDFLFRLFQRPFKGAVGMVCVGKTCDRCQKCIHVFCAAVAEGYHAFQV